MDSADSGSAAPPTPPTSEQPAAEGQAAEGQAVALQQSETPIVDELADSVRRYFDGPQFTETRQKVSAELHTLAREFDELQTKLMAEIDQAATEARTVVNQEIANLKAQHPDAMEQLGDLIGLGKEGVALADSKIGRLAEDLTSAVEKFLKDLGAPPAAAKSDEPSKPPGSDSTN